MGDVTQRWRLYVDESGNFDDPSKRVLVAGLLARWEAPGLAPATLHEALARRRGDVPWPMHATLTRRRCLHVLWAEHGATQRGEALDPLTARAVAAMEGAPKELATARKLVARGAEPHGDAWQALTTLDDVLKRGADVWADLSNRVGAWRVSIRDALEAACADGAAWLAVCGESQDGFAGPLPIEDAAAPPSRPQKGAPPLGDRYLDLLAVALERVADLLTELGGRHRVTVLADRRRVFDDRVGRAVPLRPDHVERAAVVATRAPDRVARFREGSEVVFVAGHVRDRDAAATAGLVAADWMANGSLGHVDPRSPVDRVVSAIRKDLRVSAERGHLPTIAAFGPPWDWLRAIRGGPEHGAAPGTADDARWSREQAERWAAVLMRRVRS